MGLPSVFYGTAWKKEKTSELVLMALETGFVAIDTACQKKHYEEKLVGEAIARSRCSREQLFIQTKFTPVKGQDPLSIPYDPRAPIATQVAQSVTASLKNLQVSYLDSVLLHGPYEHQADNLEAWQALEAEVAKGHVRHIGLSNIYHLDLLQSFYDRATVKPFALQNRFYADTEYDMQLRAFMRDREMMYQSFWTLTANPHLLQSPKWRTLAASLQLTEAQMLFAYLAKKSICVVTGTTSRKHMIEDLKAVGISLNPPTIAAIDEMFAPYSI